jgi:hypothetical protein
MLAAVVWLALPATAMADDFQQIFGDYKADGRIDGCYGPTQIHNASGQIPPDIEQYAPGFGDALSAAQTQCGSSQAPASEPEEEPAPISAGTGGPDVKKKKVVRDPPAPKVDLPAPTELAAPQLAPAGAAVSSEMPGALVALLVAGGLALLLALGWIVAWFMGWSPERLTKPVFAAFQSVWDRVLPGR